MSDRSAGLSAACLSLLSSWAALFFFVGIWKEYIILTHAS